MASNPKPEVRPERLTAEARTLADDSKTLAGSSGLGAEIGSGVVVPDHELLMRIGQGSYGEVWLARNVMGTYRAVKIVYRAAFEHARPFEREFNGIQKFEPISRSHDGFVDVLQIGRAPEYFYYVMELADDVVTGQQIDPATYQPKTLRSQVQAHKALPFEQCVELGLSLTAALGHLHKHGLIHRDIKPSNIIFVNGISKLADIGLVAEQSEAKSFVGTEGFIPPEGPGTPQADIYSLGKVLYEIATGKDRHEFPALPTMLGEKEADLQLLELNSVFLKACQSDVKLRYSGAESMHEDLVLLRGGGSVKRAQAVERRLKLVTRLSLAAVAVTLAAVAAFVVMTRQAAREAALRLTARQQAYASALNLAQTSLRDGNLGRAVELLQQQLPAGSIQDLRGWEWRYLWGQCTSGADLVAQRAFPIMALQYVPGGRSIAFADWRGRISFWDLSSRHETESFQTPGDCWSATISPNGRYLATAGRNLDLTIWDLSNRQRLPGFDFVRGKWTAFTSKGKALAVLSPESGTLTLFSIPIGQELWTAQVQGSGYFHGMNLAESPTDALLAVGDGAGFIHLFDTVTGELVAKAAAHKNGVAALKFSPDGRFLATCGTYGEYGIELWSVRSGLHHLKTLTGHTAWVSSFAFSPDGKLLASGSADQSIRLWSVRDWQPKATLRGHRLEVYALTFSPEGDALLSGSKDGEVRLWNVSTALKPAVWPAQITNVTDYAFSPDSEQVLMRFGNGSLALVRDAAVSQPTPLTPLGTNNWGAVFLPDGRRIVVGSADGALTVYDLARNQTITNWSVGRPLRPLGLVAEGKLLVTWPLQLWDTSSWSLRKNFGWAEWPLDVSPDGKFIARHSDPDVEIWNVQTKQRLARLVQPHLADTAAVKFPPSAEYLATCADDGKIRFWATADGHELFTLAGYVLGVDGLVFSSDGKRLFSGSSEAEAIRVWDLETRRDVLTLPAKGTAFHNLKLSPNATLLGAINADNVLNVWRAPLWEELRTTGVAPEKK